MSYNWFYIIVNMFLFFRTICGYNFILFDKTFVEYKEKNAILGESIAKYCVEATGREFTGMDQLKNPQIVTADITFANSFAAILSEAITPVVPAIISLEYTKLYDVVQVGWGDVAK